MKIGFIGQGFLGGNYANDFEARGYEVVRYSKTKFKKNKDKLKECELVIVGVPTPTINGMFQDSILLDAIKETQPGQVVIIKSTVQVGTTDRLQNLYPDRYFIHSAEFLTEENAAEDTATPSRNVFGMADSIRTEFEEKSMLAKVIEVFPQAKTVTCSAKESEMGKYMSNFLLTSKVIAANLIYDMCHSMNIDYQVPRTIASLDQRIGPSHLAVQHNGKRGAAGHCFPKDMEALFEMYSASVGSKGFGSVLLQIMSLYNMYISLETNKDQEIFTEVYGNIKVQDILALIKKECSETTLESKQDS